MSDLTPANNRYPIKPCMLYIHTVARDRGVVTITLAYFFHFCFFFFICPPQYSCRPGYTILNRALCENRFFNSKVSRGLFPVFLTPGNEIKITSGRSSPVLWAVFLFFFSIFFLFFYFFPLSTEVN